jgi:predicted metal-binding membrane protein
MDKTLTRVAAIVAAATLVAGCASANKTASSSSGNSGSSSGASANASSMGGMDMGSSGASSATAGMTVNGVKAIPSQVLATADWQGMKITARTMSAAPFIVYNGTSEQMVKPTKKTSFHLMVMLNDAHTGVAIPYAGVWATFSKAGKVVYDERQYPMLSAFMGPHYGNNVQLPGAGHYQLTLLISPPVAARHLEYQHVWLTTHKVTVNFNWKPVP